jgi:hypothetical protein
MSSSTFHNTNSISHVNRLCNCKERRYLGLNDVEITLRMEDVCMVDVRKHS